MRRDGIKKEVLWGVGDTLEGIEEEMDDMLSSGKEWSNYAEGIGERMVLLYEMRWRILMLHSQKVSKFLFRETQEWIIEWMDGERITSSYEVLHIPLLFQFLLFSPQLPPHQVVSRQFSFIHTGKMWEEAEELQLWWERPSQNARRGMMLLLLLHHNHSPPPLETAKIMMIHTENNKGGGEGKVLLL